MTSSRAPRWALFTVAFLGLLLVAAAPAPAYPERTTFDRTFPAYGGGPFVLADVTGEGFADLAAVDDSLYKIWLYPGSPAGMPQEPVHGVPVGPVSDLVAADLDGDGLVDLIAVGDQQITWLRWIGGQLETLTETLVLAGDKAAVGDLNGDGRADLALAGLSGLRVWFQRASSPLFPASADLVLSDNPFLAVAVGDADGDGRDDVIAARSYEARAYLQGSQGLDLDPVRFVTGALGDMSVALVEGSGDIPFLVVAAKGEGTEPATVSWWRWENGAFLFHSEAKGPYTARLAVGDANDDRRQDVAIATSGGSVHLYLQRSTLFTPTSDLVLDAASGSDAGVAIGDANGDGFADVVVRTRAPDRYVVFLQEDAPPALIRAIPSTYALNRGTVAPALIDLRAFFVDDHNRLTFSIVHESDPDLLAVKVEAGALTFEAADRYGLADFRVSAWDGNPNRPPIISNLFTVLVNDPPKVTSTPLLRASVGELYAYVVTVEDAYPVNDPHTFTLIEGPAGVTVDRATGLTSWTPGDTDEGRHDIAIEVRDAHGGSAVQRFAIVVAPTPTPAPTLLMVVGIAGTSAALFAAAALLNENAKWAFLLFFLPLYSKIKRERVLDHFVRGQIFGYIQANPGEHYNAIKDALGLTNGSLAHHLRTLEREQFIKSKRFGLYRRFYPMHMRLPEDGAFQPNEIQQTILDTIRENPGITQKGIASALSLTPPTVNYHVNVLSDRNLIEVVRRGRTTHCTIVEERAT